MSGMEDSDCEEAEPYGMFIKSDGAATDSMALDPGDYVAERDPSMEEACAVTVAMIMMKSNPEGTDEAKASNLKTVIRLIKSARNKGAQIACLPEMCSVGYDLEILGEKLHSIGESVDETSLECSPFITAVTAVAEEIGLALIIPVPEVESAKEYSYEQGQHGCPKQRIHSTAFIFGPNGGYLGKHQKVHLTTSNGSYANYRDDKYIAYGRDANTFEIKVESGGTLKFGVLLGSDLDFSHTDPSIKSPPRYNDTPYSEASDLVKQMSSFGAECIFCCMSAKEDDWMSKARLAATYGGQHGLFVCGTNLAGNGFSGGSVVWNGRKKGQDHRATKMASMDAAELDEKDGAVIVVKLPLHTMK